MPALLQVPFFQSTAVCQKIQESLHQRFFQNTIDRQSVKHIHVKDSEIYANAQIQGQFIVLRFSD